MPDQALPIESKWRWVFLGAMRERHTMRPQRYSRHEKRGTVPRWGGYPLQMLRPRTVSGGGSQGGRAVGGRGP